MVCISSRGGGAKAHGDGSGRVIPVGARHPGRPEAVPARLPLIALLGEDRPDRSQRRRLIGEDPGHVRPTLDLLAEALGRVRRPDRAPVVGEDVWRPRTARTPCHRAAGHPERGGRGGRADGNDRRGSIGCRLVIAGTVWGCPRGTPPWTGTRGSGRGMRRSAGWYQVTPGVFLGGHPVARTDFLLRDRRSSSPLHRCNASTGADAWTALGTPFRPDDFAGWDAHPVAPPPWL